MQEDPDPFDIDAESSAPTTQPALGRPRSIVGVVGPIVLVVLMISVALLAMLSVTPQPSPIVPSARPEGADLVIVGASTVAWDPALAGDAQSASVLAQVWEGLTTFDPAAQVQPALAQSWEVSEGGNRLTFTMRPGITFSDGTPITSQDVVASWLRIIDPVTPGPLSGLLTDIVGAAEYMAGQASADDVGLRADRDRVVVDLVRPASWFPAAAAAPTMAIVPASLPAAASGPLLPDDLVVSGAYIPSDQSEDGFLLTANPRYWAGTPAIERIRQVTSLDGGSVDAFQAGDVDYVNISSDDASWIRYDRTLGPQLRRSDDLSVEYYGFDATRPPFDDARVRQAFAWAIDWASIVRLSDATAVPATSMVPPGIAGRGDGDFSPAFDPDAARAALAAAGYPGGVGFPHVTLVTSGSAYQDAVRDGIQRELGISLTAEQMPFDEYSARLDSDTPQMWSLAWSADYPHPNDFLGLLLETGSPSNAGGWSNTAFDDALDAAAATADSAEQEALYVDAERIVQDQVPVIPLRYGETWALSRDGLLGAAQSGIGIVRYAGLDWADR
ncbi:MAG: peptide ABC transporter substrate-binding protein [Chloroflexi bacterium]|nr:peptide ABC transporter substrate-binding protein [Chloroflexota bacterium]